MDLNNVDSSEQKTNKKAKMKKFIGGLIFYIINLLYFFNKKPL